MNIQRRGGGAQARHLTANQSLGSWFCICGTWRHISDGPHTGNRKAQPLDLLLYVKPMGDGGCESVWKCWIPAKAQTGCKAGKRLPELAMMRQTVANVGADRPALSVSSGQPACNACRRWDSTTATGRLRWSHTCLWIQTCARVCVVSRQQSVHQSQKAKRHASPPPAAGYARLNIMPPN